MSIFELMSLVTLTVALFGYINYRFIKLPDTLGITVVGLVVSVGFTLFGNHEPKAIAWAQNLVDQIDFTEVVFHGMLPLLLFASSLHVNIAEIAKEKISIFLLASIGVALSTVVVGFVTYYGLAAINIQIPLLYCMLFGAVVSPTDAIVAMGVLKKVGVAKSLETKICGESLFNDGTAVVAYLLILGMIAKGGSFEWASAGGLLLKEVVGALVVGLLSGYAAVFLLKGVDSYPVEIVITLALATSGYALAEAVHVSAPLAIVVSGLVVGNLSDALMSEKTQKHLFGLWELLDELLNLILFGLIGVEVIALDMTWTHLLVGLVGILAVILARFVSVSVPLSVLRPFEKTFSPHAIKILTWGGLRGSISIALALSLPNFAGKDLLIGATYIVVLFSLLVQAPTLSLLLKKLSAAELSENQR